MDGDARIRLCSQCNKNVYNLSDMPNRAVAKLLENTNGRICVTGFQLPDGRIATDNCPKLLRPLRDKVRTYAASTLITLSLLVGSSAEAQGLVGAPVDPRYGQSNNVGIFADFGYDTARDISRIATGIAIVLMVVVPLPTKKLSARKRLAVETIARIGIPLLVHLIGTSMINNFGGLGGCVVGGVDGKSKRIVPN